MALVDIPLVVFLMLFAMAAGWRLIQVLRLELEDEGARLVFSVGLGLGVLVYSTLLLGFLGALNRLAAYGLLIALTLVLHRDFLAVGGRLWSALRTVRIRSISPVSGSLVALLSIFLLFNLLQALAPPTSADTLAYHYSLPKSFLLEHRLYYIPDILTNAPLNQHMLYTLGMLLHQVVVASLIGYAQGIVLIAAVVLFSHRYFTVRIGLLAAVLLYSPPLVTQIISSGHIEIGLTTFTFLAVWGFIEWTKSHDYRWLILSGIFLGLVAGTKYYGLFSVLSLGLVAAWAGVRLYGRNVTVLVRTLAAFAIITTLVASPWYIRNLVNTGNPVYPAFYGVLGGKDWSLEMDEFFYLWITTEKRPAGDSIAAFSTSVWDFTINKADFGARIPEYMPIYLAFFPLLLWLFYKDRDRRWLYGYLLAFSLIFYALWFWLAFQRLRHLMPIMPWIAIITSAATLHAVDQSRKIHGGLPLRWAIYAALGTVFFISLGINLLFNSQFIPVVAGFQDKDSYLKSQLAYFEDVSWINANLTNDDKLMHFDRTINYHLDVNYFYASQYVQAHVDWAKGMSADELAQWLETENITHIFADERMLKNDFPESPLSVVSRRQAEILNEVIERYGEEVYRSDRSVPQYRTLDRGSRTVASRVYRLSF